jgi:pentapeptide MXKDX repeat protein
MKAASHEKKYHARVTTEAPGTSKPKAAPVAPGNNISKGIQTMTIRTRIALGISAAALSFSLALAPAAFADDMSKDGMKKETMSKDGMKKDTMSKDSMSKDSMSKDSMSKDGMKKDDGMMKKN